MGRKLDALLGRNFRICKLKAVTKLAISRITILRKQRQARYSQAKYDVVDILRLEQHERALIRVEHAMKDRNMLDALDMMENYCKFLIERVLLLEKKNKECPDELKEAISSLIFASSRCAEFPELQEIRGLFQLRFGKEFAARAIELRNNCGVNPKIIQKFSARPTTLETRIEALRSIASEVHITLDLKLHAHPPPAAELMTKEVDDHQLKRADLIPDEEEFSSEHLRSRNNYRDVAAAAQEAFESAAYAATAARAAFELSRSSSSHHYHHYHDDTSCSDSESDHEKSSEPGSTFETPSSKLDYVNIGQAAESTTTMDKQIVLYEAYEEEEEEGENDQLHGNKPALLEHHNFDQESGKTQEWNELDDASDRHRSNFVDQLYVPQQPRSARKNTHK